MAIVGKNPGDAAPNVIDKFAEVDLREDQMLKFVENRFNDAYKECGREIPINAFVRGSNLMYFQNKDLKAAIRTNKTLANAPVCNSENEKAPIVWFGWGGSDKNLYRLKIRAICKIWLETCVLRSEAKCPFCAKVGGIKNY